MSYLTKVKIATQNLEDKIIDYQDWAETVLGPDYRDVYSSEYLRRASKVFSIFLKNAEGQEVEGDKSDELRELLSQIKAERIKLSTTNIEYNAIQRAEARNDLFTEELIRAIGRLEPLQIPEHENTYRLDGDSTLLITLSDFHAGSTFEVRGLYGETVNKYDYNIMWHRLYNLIDQIEADCIDFKDCKVAILGDCFENILRTSSLLKLREPVIDTVIRFSEDMCRWLLHLHLRLDTDIEVITVGGNHDTQRLLESRPTFEDENLTKFVVAYMKQRYEGIAGFNINNYQEIAIKNIHGTNVMFCHGEDKDLSTTMDYFSNLYNVDIGEGYGGHLHRPESKAIGITEVGDRVFTRVGSIVGIDTFAKKIRVAARPSAYVAIYTDNGKTWSRNYYL
jgi:predicted phosphodiesterase